MWTEDGLKFLRDVLARAACHHRGHDWRQTKGKPDSALAALWRPVTLCWRCGQLDVGQVSGASMRRGAA